MKPEYYRFVNLGTADEVAEAASQDILQAAIKAIAERGKFKLVLAGGTTPEKVYRLLAQTNADWQHWWIYHGDERCLPVDHKDRNSLMAREVWLSHVDIPQTQIFDIPAELGPAQGALAYRSIVEAAMPFDVVLLGMGEDGHTASLFPGHVNKTGELTHAVSNSPKPPPERVSLSAKTLSNAAEVMFLITGANKHEAFEKWLAGDDLPVAGIRGEKTVIYTDKAANPG